MASTKKKKKKDKPLFKMEDLGKAADTKQTLYLGYVGEAKIGHVCARNAAEAKKKLLRIARSKLK